MTLQIAEKDLEWIWRRSESAYEGLCSHNPYECNQGFHDECREDFITRAMMAAYRRGFRKAKELGVE